MFVVLSHWNFHLFGESEIVNLGEVFLRQLIAISLSANIFGWTDRVTAYIHDVEAWAGLSSVKISRSSIFLLNYLFHTYDYEFPLPIWPLCASHQRWKQLFCHSLSQRSEKDFFWPFPNIYLKLIHVQVGESISLNTATLGWSHMAFCSM